MKRLTLKEIEQEYLTRAFAVQAAMLCGKQGMTIKQRDECLPVAVTVGLMAFGARRTFRHRLAMQALYLRQYGHPCESGGDAGNMSPGGNASGLEGKSMRVGDSGHCGEDAAAEFAG